jgi:radical SAM protein with 4Fe4S-binding SPASM domain
MFVNWTDAVQLLSKLTLNRVTNALKILISYLISRLTHRPTISGLPISIAIEPTTYCNLRCPECPSGLRSFTRPTGELEMETFRKIISEVESTTTYLTFYFQGEPYLLPGFLNMVRLANESKMYTATSTNAHYLDEKTAERTVKSGLDRIIISIDGTDQETYEQYRVGGKLQKVLAGTKNILKWRDKLGSKTPAVVWQFLVVKPNESQIPEVKRLGKEMGVDKIVFKTAQIYDYKNGNDLIPEQDRYSRYKKQSDGSYKIKNKLLDHCWKMWSSCVITWDGKVVPCCFDKDASHAMGEINNRSFREIWYSAPYKNFRKAILRSRSEVEMCKNCTEGSKIWA